MAGLPEGASPPNRNPSSSLPAHGCASFCTCTSPRVYRVGLPLVRTAKACPMCGVAFTPQTPLRRPSDDRRSAVIGTIFCSAPCSNRFESEIGGNPVLHDFETPMAPVCRDCGVVLEHVIENRRCRLCRLERTIRTRIRGEKRRLVRQKKVRDAQKTFGLPETPWEVVD
jgi:hypothetical protein